jgi:hypothetical protein
MVLALAARLLVTAIPPAAAQGPRAELELVDQLGGQMTRMAVQGSLAYVVVGPRLQVLDVSVPTAPRLLGQTPPLTYEIRALAVQGRYVYAAAGGLHVFDVGDPSRPTEVGTLAIPGQPQAIAVDGERVYLSGAGVGLFILSVADPAHPRQLGADLQAGGNAIAVAGNYLYSAPGSDLSGNTLHVWYVAYPSDIARAGAYQPAPSTSGTFAALALGNGRLYAAEQPYFTVNGGPIGGGLRVFDLSDATRPRAGALLDTPGWPNDLAIGGGRAYLAESAYGYPQDPAALVGGLRVADLSEPADPRDLGTTLGGDYARLALVGTTVLLLDQGRGLQIVDAADPGRATRVGAYEPPGPSLAVATTGGRVYQTEGAYGTNSLTNPRLRVVDTSDPARLRTVGVVELSRIPNAIAAAGNYAYAAVSPLRQNGQLASAAGVQVIDASDPTRPIEGAFLPTDGTYQTVRNPIKVAVADGRLYVLEGDAIERPGGLRIYELTDPALPQALGFVEIRGATDVAVLGGRAYTIDFRAAQAIDVSDPTRPRVVGSFPAPSANGSGDGYRGVAAVGQYVYLGVWQQILHGGAPVRSIAVFDVIDPTLPRQVGSFPSSLEPGAAANGLLVAAGPTSLQVWQGDPTCPSVVGSYAVGGKVALAGDRIFVASGTQGLYELRFGPLAGGGTAATCQRLYLPLVPHRGGA